MCLKLKITLLNCFFQDICLVFPFLINLHNSSPIADAFDPFLHFDAANECKSTYLAKNSVVIFLQKVKSIAEQPLQIQIKDHLIPLWLFENQSQKVAMLFYY